MGTVMTVLGPVDSSQLGTTITHEHVFIDLSCYLTPPKDEVTAERYNAKVKLENLYIFRSDPYGNRDNCILDDMDLAIRELAVFQKLGGKTVVDVTLDDIGRDVVKLAEVSRRTGLHILAGCGHYIHAGHPSYVAAQSAEDIAQKLIREIEQGVGETGIKPGVIGEIGTGDPIHPEEAKVLRGAARAQIATGLPISVHVHPPGRRGNEVLDILIDEGVAPERIILGHVDVPLSHLDIDFAQGVDYVLSLAERGCYIEFDLCGNAGYFRTRETSWWMPTDRERAKALAILCDRGFKHKILLSQDVGHKHYLQEYGGWGYGHVLSEFRHHLEDAGVSRETSDLFLLDNPAKILSIATAS
jgi:phosphotriesterase-related protein